MKWRERNITWYERLKWEEKYTLVELPEHFVAGDHNFFLNDWSIALIINTDGSAFTGITKV